jgi:hypothetical protein
MSPGDLVRPNRKLASKLAVKLAKVVDGPLTRPFNASSVALPEITWTFGQASPRRPFTRRRWTFVIVLTATFPIWTRHREEEPVIDAAARKENARKPHEPYFMPKEVLT